MLYLRLALVSGYLIGGAVIFGLVGVIALIAWALGKKSERIKGAEATADIREKQLEAANERPKDKDELVRVLREKGL